MVNFNKKNSELPKSKQIISKVFFGLFYTILAVYAFTFLYIVLWAVMNSLKDSYFCTMFPFSLPDKLFPENFTNAWKGLSVTIWSSALQKNLVYKYDTMFLYSLCYALGSTTMSIYVPFLVAYILAKYKFRGRNFLFNMAIFIMVLPSMGSLASSLYVRKILGIYDNMPLFILTAAGGFEGNFLLIYGVAKSFGWDYGEAAFIDGASNHTVMYKIYLPLMMPTLGALFVIGFLGSWNDYMTIITYLPSTPNLAYGIYLFKTCTTVNQISTPVTLAAYLIVALPTIILWTCSQKLIKGMAVVGGLKG